MGFATETPLDQFPFGQNYRLEITLEEGIQKVYNEIKDTNWE